MRIAAEKSFEYAEEALSDIRKNACSASPMAFELWFTHVAGMNPKLSRELAKLLESNKPLDDNITQNLHDRFFSNPDVTKEVIAATDDVSAHVAKIIDRIANSGENYQTFSNSLNEALVDLESVEDKSQLRSLVEVLSNATNSMNEKNRELEKQLVDTQSELTTLKDDVNRIRDEAYTDGLTGIANRKRFDAALLETIEARRDEEIRSCLLLGDVDHFKSFNDKWGHQVGDQVLKLVAAGLSANTKGRDLVARYGGEEFAIILPDTNLSDAMGLADKLRNEISTRRLTRKTTNEVIGHVTISFGVAQIEYEDEPSDVIERADKCLYLAKDRGRNCVVGENELS